MIDQLTNDDSRGKDHGGDRGKMIRAHDGRARRWRGDLVMPACIPWHARVLILYFICVSWQTETTLQEMQVEIVIADDGLSLSVLSLCMNLSSSFYLATSGSDRIPSTPLSHHLILLLPITI